MPAPVIPVVQNVNSLPPGGGGLVIRHQETFAGVYNGLTRTYRPFHDEALFDNVNNAIRMLLDPAITEPLNTRARETAQLPWHIDADDDADPAQIEAAENISRRLKRTPRLQDLFMSLLEATWYGRSGAQVLYKWETIASKMGISVYDHVPINGDKLVFGYQPITGAPGRVGVRVAGVYTGNWEPTDYGPTHFFSDHDRQSLIIHRYRLKDSDWRQPYKAGAIQGQGVREDLYWIWEQKQFAFSMLADYLRWFAQGLTVYYYLSGDQKSYNEARDRAEEGQGKAYLLWPQFVNSENFKPFDRLDPSAASTNLLQALITNYYDGVIRRSILGTSGTTVGGPTGLGSSTSEVLERTADGVIKYDATSLQDTLTQDLLAVMYAYTYPGMPPGRFVFEIDSPDVLQFIQAAQFYIDNGGEVGSESTRKTLGLPAVGKNEAVLGKLQAQQPTAVAGTPEGVPIVEGQSPDQSSQESSAPNPGPAVPPG